MSQILPSEVSLSLLECTHDLSIPVQHNIQPEVPEVGNGQRHRYYSGLGPAAPPDVGR